MHSREQSFGRAGKNRRNPIADLLWVLLMTFILLYAIQQLCIVNTGEKTVSVNTSGKGGMKTADNSLLADIGNKDGKMCITQNNVSYILPDDLEQFRKKARFETRKDEKGNPYLILIVRDPGKNMTAGQMLSVVQMLNKAEVGVDFRTVPDEGG
ncbi:MAG: hypothetical protein GY749_45760 [Desulfobacteraceae bacterium]|nr:hypothetical protein [Desulfobacteraceae bacterium]